VEAVGARNLDKLAWGKTKKEKTRRKSTRCIQKKKNGLSTQTHSSPKHYNL
jgi:hypothetical protein